MTKIKVEDLTIKEARELYAELGNLFGKQESPSIPINPYVIPVAPRNPFSSWLECKNTLDSLDS